MKISLFIFLLSIYLITMGGHMYSSDDTTLYYTSRSIVEESNINIPLNSDTKGLVAVVYGIDRNFYSQYPIIQPLMAVPLFILGKLFASFFHPDFYEFITRFVVSMFNSIIVALTAIVLYSFLLKFYSKKVSLIVTLLFGLGTVVWPHSQTFLSEPLPTLFLLLTFYNLYKFKHNGETKNFILGSIFFGFTFVTKFISVLALLTIFIYLILENNKDGILHIKLKNLRYCIIFTLFASPVIFFNQLYNYLIFGSFFTFGYAKGSLNGLDLIKPFYLGVYGLLLSTGRSIFVYSPPLLLFFFSIRQFYKKHKLEAIFLILFILAFLLFFSGLNFWHGQNSWGPRYLYYLIPFFLIPIGYCIDYLINKKHGYKFLTLLFIISIFIQLLGFSMVFNYYIDYTRPSLPISERDNPQSPIFLYTIHFNPYYSPILGHLRLLPSLIKNTFITQKVPKMPFDPQGLYAWYWSPVLDFWWAWWYYSGLPKIFIGFLILPISYALISGYRLYKKARMEEDL